MWNQNLKKQKKQALNKREWYLIWIRRTSIQNEGDEKTKINESIVKTILETKKFRFQYGQ